MQVSVANSLGGCTVTNAAVENMINGKFERNGSYTATMHKDLTISINLANSWVYCSTLLPLLCRSFTLAKPNTPIVTTGFARALWKKSLAQNFIGMEQDRYETGRNL